MAELPFVHAEGELTEQQLRFVAEYVADPRSATRAYQRAFNLHPVTSYNSAGVAAHALLKNLKIQAEIKACRHEWCKRHKITFQSTVRKLASIAFGDADDYYESDPENEGLPKPRPWREIPATARKNIKSIKFKRRKLKNPKDSSDCATELEELEYKLVDPEWALGKLCEYLGVTKGSLTTDELKQLIFGTTARAHQTNVPAPATGGAESAAGTGEPTPFLVELDPDE